MAAVTICSDFGAQENKVCHFPLLPHPFPMKWWDRQEYTEKLYKKDFHDPVNHDGVITQIEPDILECEVK